MDTQSFSFVFYAIFVVLGSVNRPFEMILVLDFVLDFEVLFVFDFDVLFVLDFEVLFVIEFEIFYEKIYVYFLLELTNLNRSSCSQIQCEIVRFSRT